MSSLKNETPLVRLGNAIREIRKERGISQEDLAYDSDIGRSHMGALERGEINASILTLLKLCETLKVPLADIITRAKL